ncbi:uncharacterized protein LOC107850050 [Capsicum annuum]|uniref:uncharacterized protein LOC107850050 n=1 Tax=Capsicum annuum TaxID=4072 RepID=UPI001FB1885A|nr:uncharacterized protein LOC107850050 [Capsicum annuum]
MERYGEENIPTDKFKFSNWSRSRIVIKFFQATALQNGVKEIVYGDPYWFTPTYRFPIIKVLAGKSLPELVLSGCDLMAVSLFSGAVHCQSLRKFSLYLIFRCQNCMLNCGVPNVCGCYAMELSS